MLSTPRTRRVAERTPDASSGRLRRALAVLLGTAVVAVLPPSVGADPESESGTTTTAVPGSASGVRQVDAVRADAAALRRSRGAIRAEIAALQARYDEQWNRWALTQVALEQARADLARSDRMAADARRDLEEAHGRVRMYAANAFMNPPMAASLALLSISDANEVERARDLLSVSADHQGSVVELMDTARATHEQAMAASSRLAADAEERAAASQAELDSLDALLAEQRQLDAEIDDRLDAALAEVASLEAIDRRAADDLRQKEEELARRTAPVEVAPATRTRTPSSSPSPAPATTAPRTPASTPAVPSGPPPALPSGLATWQDVTKVGGIWVHRSIASNVSALLSAASAAGLSLGGGGFRDSADQIRLRTAHCGPTEWDIWYKPASQCTPPTAPPGRSMHERGLAIDFTSSGSLITSRSNPAYQWLAANAASYGLYNLPSEPWHWSTNGN